MGGESPQGRDAATGERSGSVRHHAHMESAIRAGNVSSRLGAGGYPLRLLSMLAGATLRMSPARLTRGAPPPRPRTGPRSRRGSRIAGCRPDGRRTCRGPPCQGGSAVPTGRFGSESDVAAPVNPTRSWPSRKGSLVRERPLEGRDEGVNPHSSLSRTKPSGRGVAPAPARTARSATGGRTAEPQGVAVPADEWQGPCESREPQSVNRPPASISRSSAA